MRPMPVKTKMLNIHVPSSLSFDLSAFDSYTLNKILSINHITQIILLSRGYVLVLSIYCKTALTHKISEPLHT